MTEQAPDNLTAMLRGLALVYFVERGLPIGVHEGATVVERARYSAAFLDFVRGYNGDEHTLLLAAAASKLSAMTVVRTSPHPSDRVDFRNWRREVIERAWLVGLDEPTVQLAAHLATAMENSNAHEAALDTLVAITVAAEEIHELSSEGYDV